MSRVRIPPNPLRYRLFSGDSFKKIGDRKRVNPYGCVAMETMPTTTLETTTDPWMLFLYALKAPQTKEKYIQRLIKFLDFLGYQGTKEEKARAFAARAKADSNYGFNSVLKFFQMKRE
jgi:hypothetical protein